MLAIGSIALPILLQEAISLKFKTILIESCYLWTQAMGKVLQHVSHQMDRVIFVYRVYVSGDQMNLEIFVDFCTRSSLRAGIGKAMSVSMFGPTEL